MGRKEFFGRFFGSPKKEKKPTPLRDLLAPERREKNLRAFERDVEQETFLLEKRLANQDARELDYAPLARVMIENAVAEMVEGCGFGPELQKASEEILWQEIAEPFIDLQRKRESTQDEALVASISHRGFLAGQIERQMNISFTSGRDRQVLRDITAETLSMREKRKAQYFVMLLMERFPELPFPEYKKMEEFLVASPWLLEPFDFNNKREVDSQYAGAYVANAVVSFAKEVFPAVTDEDVLIGTIEGIFNISDGNLQEMLEKNNPQDPWTQILQFGVRAAHFLRNFSRVPQGLEEQQESPARGRSNHLILDKEINPDFTPFDNLQYEENWESIFLSVNQVRTALSALRDGKPGFFDDMFGNDKRKKKKKNDEERE